MANNQLEPFEILTQTITAASQLPFVKVDREQFLRQEFKNDKYIDVILEKGPQEVYKPDVLKRKAIKIINDTTNKTTVLAFMAGLPGNPIVAGVAATADITQFFGFALHLSQKIAYLYGEDNLFDNSKQISDETKIRIIAYLGVMFGASGANTLILKVAKNAGPNIGKKVAAKALTKTTWYPLVKKVGTILGIKINKKIIGNVISKMVPVIGGVISGGITYTTFKPMGIKLSKTFYSQLLNSNSNATEELLNPEFLNKIKHDVIII